MTAQNEQDLRLLHENPEQFLVRYQEVIRIIVRAFIRTRAIHESDHDDTIQYVNEKLWTRIDRIREMYNGQSLVKTYMSVVIRNLVMERRKERHYCLVEEPLEFYETAGSNAADQFLQLVIKQELERLDTIMKTFHKQRLKFEFCLKIVFRIPVAEDDFRELVHPLSPVEQKRLWKLFDRNTLPEDKDQYRRLSEVFNTLEDQSGRSRDSIRKWIRHRLDMVLLLMNGTPRQAHYNDETLQILFERYFITNQVDIQEFSKAEMRIE